MKLVRKEFSQGAFGTIIKFKNLTIQNMDISTPTYEVQGWGETYTIKVTRTKVVGSELHAYSAYDTESDSTKMFLNHSTIRVPDYDRFKTFATTCIIHNLDSRVMDKAASAIQAKGEWCIAIHDAMLVMPGTALREEFTAIMEQVRTDRKSILGNYLESIGATSTKAKVALVNLLNHDYQCPQDEPLSGSMLK